MINSFTGNYFFLSNFYQAPVWYQGMQFQNNEAAFQAAKCPEKMIQFTILNPSQAKRLGRRVPLRPDWEDVKDKVMYTVCKGKFLQNPYLLKKLMDTGDAELIEGNTWGDKIWGQVNGVGENRLGKILMNIRTEIQAAMSDDNIPIIDEVGGVHISGTGTDPDGKFCGECNSLSCGSCQGWLDKEKENRDG